jgi:hypothetical protein
MSAAMSDETFIKLRRKMISGGFVPRGQPRAFEITIASKDLTSNSVLFPVETEDDYDCGYLQWREDSGVAGMLLSSNGTMTNIDALLDVSDEEWEAVDVMRVMTSDDDLMFLSESAAKKSDYKTSEAVVVNKETESKVGEMATTQRSFESCVLDCAGPFGTGSALIGCATCYGTVNALACFDCLLGLGESACCVGVCSNTFGTLCKAARVMFTVSAAAAIVTVGCNGDDCAF